MYSYSLTGTWLGSKLSRRSAAAGQTTEHVEWVGGGGGDRAEERTRPPIDFEQEMAIFSRGESDAAALENNSVVPSCEERGGNELLEAADGNGLPLQDMSLRVVPSWKERIWDERLVVSETGSSSSPGPTLSSPDAVFCPKKEEKEEEGEP